MRYANSQSALNQYRQVDVHGGVAEASPHRLIQLLMRGAQDKIAFARGYLERGDYQEKGRHIGGAATIIEALRTCLDTARGEAIAANLAALYEYMNRCLLEANLENDGARLVEVAGLLGQVQSAWDAIADRPEVAVR
ncbi:MAG: flagellar export chaperone FliS [Porticoccaceae bacterium]